MLEREGMRLRQSESTLELVRRSTVQLWGDVERHEVTQALTKTERKTQTNDYFHQQNSIPEIMIPFSKPAK